MRTNRYIRRLVRLVRGRATPAESNSLPQLRMLKLFAKGERTELPALPKGYELAFYQAGDEARWLRLINESGEFGVWNEELLQAEILSTLIPGSAVFVIADEKLVACAAGCDLKNFRPFATLMYVVVLSEHRGKGLGVVVTAAAINGAQEAGYPGMILQTDDFRLAAIKTYLKLGFVPHCEHDAGAGARWELALKNIEGQYVAR